MIKPEAKIVLLEKEIQRLKKLVYLDALTNVYNRRGFLEIGGNYFKSFKEDNPACAGRGKHRKNEITSLALIFLDIDDFKKINDKYGHQKGDRVLKQLAKFLKLTLRTTDLIGRWGGEEFVILLVNVSEVNAQRIAQKLCQLIAQAKIASLYLTISSGLIIAKKEQILAAIINKADKLMYQAKKQGKNQVIFIK
ncbi:MAG: GGDEF domain-containing protein [Candidatus Paceibacterota bacterium]|jgi:PleD family two-component response regulator